MLIRNLSRFKFEVLLLLFSLIYVICQTNRGIWVPEEAPFLDYGFITRAMFSSEKIRVQVSFNEQFSMFFPWGFISDGIYGVGLSVVTHFYIMLFIRTASLLLVAKCLFSRFSNSFFGSIISIAFFAVPTIRYGLTFAAWWSHLVLIMSILLFFSRKESYLKYQIWVWPIIFITFTVSIWTNLPHLVTAWLVLPAGVLSYSKASSNFRELKLRVIAVFCVALTVYADPLFLYINHLSLWANVDQKRITTFHGMALIKVLQGFGGWFYFEKGCLENYCFYSDYSNFRSFGFLRQIIRIVFFFLAALFPFVYFFRSKLSKAINLNLIYSEKRLVFLSLLTMGYFGLSIVGNFEFFWDLRDKLPWILGYFRDPYHKFSPTYLVFLYWFVSVLIYQSSSKIESYKLKSILLAAPLFAAYLVAPAMYRLDSYNPEFGNGPTAQIKNDEWIEMESQLAAFERTAGKWCLVDSAGFRSPIAFAQARFTESLSNRAFLRTFIINDALGTISETIDQNNFCDQVESIPTLVTRTPFQYMLNPADVGGLIDGVSQIPNDSCVDNSSKYFLFLKNRCLTNIELKISTSEQKILSLAKIGNYELVNSSDPIWVQQGEGIDLKVAKRDDGVVFSVVIEVVPAFGPSAPRQELDIYLDGVRTTLDLVAGNKYSINRSLSNGKNLHISSNLPCMIPSQVYPGSPDGRQLCFVVTRVKVISSTVGG